MDIQQDSTHIPQIEDFYAVIHNKLFEKISAGNEGHLFL